MRNEIWTLVIADAVLSGILAIVMLHNRQASSYGAKIIKGQRCIKLVDGLFCEVK